MDTAKHPRVKREPLTNISIAEVKISFLFLFLNILFSKNCVCLYEYV